jgi:uncharacterized membrane protein
MLHYLTITGLGLLTGGRTMAVLAAISSRLARAESPQVRGPLHWLVRSWVARLLRIMAVGEIVGDKIPNIPARTEVPGLIGRTTAGALTGALFSAAKGRSRGLGALVGGVAALGGSFLGYYARREAVESSGVPDPVVAAIEDSIVLGGARVLLHGISGDGRRQVETGGREER